MQESLNKIKAQHGGPAVPLVVDGKCGPKTKRAIQDFQLKQFGWTGTDGVVEPGRRTLARINQILFSNVSIDPNEHANIKLTYYSRSAHRAVSMLAGLPPTTRSIVIRERRP